MVDPYVVVSLLFALAAAVVVQIPAELVGRARLARTFVIMSFAIAAGVFFIAHLLTRSSNAG